MTRKKQKNKKKLFWLFVIILILAGAGGYFVMKSLDTKEENKGEILKQEEQKEQSKEDIKNNENKNEKEDEFAGKKVTQYEGKDANDSDSLTGVVTYAAVVGDKLTVRVSIDQYLSSGTCGLTLLHEGVNVYSSIANIVGSASTSTCEGFDVPMSELEGGTMEININLSSGEREGAIRGEVNI